MSRIDELVRRLCPDGVEYKPLGEITKKQTMKNKGEACHLAYSITQAGLVPTSEYFKEAKVTSSDTTGYRVVERGWFVYSPSRIDVGSINYLCDADEVIVSPINVVFSIDQSVIGNSYLLSYLKSSRGMWLIEGKRQGIEGTGRKNLPYERFAEIEVPVPPLEVQQEIVRILDSFTELEANLQRELDARKRQYEHYRDNLLDFSTEVPRVRLDNLAKVCSSKRVFKSEIQATGVPFYRGTEIGLLAERKAVAPELFISEAHHAELVSKTGQPAIGDLLMPSICSDGRVWLVDTDAPFYVKDGRVLWVRSSESEIDSSFLCYMLSFLLTRSYETVASGTPFAELKIVSLSALQIPVPSSEAQREI
ncbi:MAG: restriction endonuclease subunit S, partial [Coriobacteriales bacterium]